MLYTSIISLFDFPLNSWSRNYCFSFQESKPCAGISSCNISFSTKYIFITDFVIFSNI